ncbi:hypothetical protein SPONN_10 [uncultured Candidatus Thioglobus sp.]|nr:hypothetical protein SPONN_10 [uncultured Candidatus Thioglobus sp.]
MQKSPVATSTHASLLNFKGGAPSIPSTTQTEHSSHSCSQQVSQRSPHDDVLISNDADGVEAQANGDMSDSDGTVSHIQGSTGAADSDNVDINSELDNHSTGDSDSTSDSDDTDAESEFEVSYNRNQGDRGDSDEGDSDDEMELEKWMLKPIYENADITLCGAYCAIMEFKRACHVPFTAIKMLLQLLQLLCPKENTLPQSVHLFKKFFKRYASKFQRRQFCPDCKVEFREDQKQCGNSTCSRSEPNTLISFDPRKAIKRVLKSKLPCNSACMFY